jgi:GTPase
LHSDPYKIKTPTALLIGVNFGLPNFDVDLGELSLLVQTAGLNPLLRVCCNRKAPDSALFIGSGKAEEIKQLAVDHEIAEIFFDQALSPSQQRNLERFFGLPVNDRVYLILEIFSQRASSHEGKLQVELARLQYLSTRLVRRWSHLERQRGGIGTRGGPGEAQIELDRRMIGDAIKRTKERLQKVLRQRETQRKQRKRGDLSHISLVGYTNAGKSSLFNTLVKSNVYAANQLFATLDTTTRQLYLGDEIDMVSLSDTVGFIRDLPHSLVASFKATLQEVTEADLLLHVVDASNSNYREQMEQVHLILQEIGAKDIPQIIIFNKIDAMADDIRPIRMDDYFEVDGSLIQRMFVSCKTNEGIDGLRARLIEIIGKRRGRNSLISND